VISPETCRAARALIDWSQQQVAKAANVGVSTVKNFEAGHSTPTANNLSGIQSALEHAGVEFVSEEHGGPGVLARRLRLRAYIRGEGLHFEVKYTDLRLEAPDNDFDLSFKLNEAALTALGGRPIANEGDAKAVVRTHYRKLISVLKGKLARDRLSCPGGRPREITPEDIYATNQLAA
jgi:transcriptional regulator with XRE-family HTH domain